MFPISIFYLNVGIYKAYCYIVKWQFHSIIQSMGNQMIKPQSHQPRDQSVILAATGHKRKMYITQLAGEPLWD